MNFLITGGTGSFGQAYVKHLLTSSPAERICIFSRDEFKQAQMRQAFNDDPRLRFFIGDVRDRDRLTRAMIGVDVVIHAAALKRIEVGHYNPDEMVKTNIMGAMNVIDAAHIANVSFVVALSTDKAYQPISSYGHSKAMAEQLFLNANDMFGATGPKFAVTRYGNVWGSKGSVVPTWRQMIRNQLIESEGNTSVVMVPVSDTEVTRFYMSMDEAVELVSGAVGKSELVIPPNLPAYRLGDLAEAMGARMNVLGLGEYEKLHESMAEGYTSDKARRMSVEELQEKLREI